MRLRSALPMLTVSLSALTVLQPAYAAVEAQKVADAITAQFANFGMTIKAAGSELQGSNVVLKGVELTPAAGATATPLGDVTLENVTEDGAGYKVGQISAPASKTDKDGVTMNFGGAAIRNVTIAAPGETDPLKTMLIYDAIEVMPVTFSMNGADVFRMSSAKVTMSPYAAGQPLSFDMVADGIYGNLSQITDPQAKEMFASLGYSEVNGVISAKGSWNPTDGRMTISEETFDFKDIGKLNFTVDLSGYTSDFIKATQEIAKTSAGGDAAAGMKMMGLMQQLNLHSISLRFDDASLTGRILDYAAKQSGQQREAIAAQVKGMAPMVVMQLQDANLTTSVTNAVTAYIDNPKSFEIKAAPAAPVAFSVLMASGMSSPSALIQQLNVQIVANQ